MGTTILYFLGNHKIEGIIFINLKPNLVGFFDNYSYHCQTVLKINDNKIRGIAKNDFYLFRNAF